MNNSLAIIVAGTLVAVAVLYSNGSFQSAAPKDEPYMDAVRSKLKDPDSAQFRNVKKHPSLAIWCGEVNAKNSFGGYIGWQNFNVLNLPEEPKWHATLGSELGTQNKHLLNTCY